MSVGKASIQRAAAKNTAEAKTTKAATKAATKTATKTANKTAAGKTTGRVTAKAAPKEVTQSVVTPMDSQEIQLKFLSGNRPAEEGKPVKIAEDLPVYLL